MKIAKRATANEENAYSRRWRRRARRLAVWRTIEPRQPRF